MKGLSTPKAARALWALVTGVGVLVILIVLALQLIPRLDSGEAVLDDVGPAFADERVAGHKGAITIVSQITDLADPIATKSGTAASEVPKLVAFVAGKTGLSNAQVLDALDANAPNTTALLKAIPLSDVTAEQPALLKFLAGALDVSQSELKTILGRDFPRLAQVVASLPTVTNGWDKVPGTEGLTRFDGTQVTDVPSVRDFFAADVVPAVERNRDNLQNLDGKGGVGYIPYLLLAIGGLVTFFGAMMLLSIRSGPMGAGEGMAMWGVVTAGGLVVLALVLGLGLFGRLGGGQELLDDTKPIFTDQRVEGERAGINMVSSIVDLGDPIATNDGGAGVDVAKLVLAVGDKTGLSVPETIAALEKAAPKTTALLQALPLSAVAAEIPGLVTFLSKTLKLPEADVVATIGKEFPGLAQVIANVGPVTGGWNAVPDLNGLTRFSGAPVTDVPDVRDYFSKDVVAAVETRREDYQKLESTFPPVDVYAILLLVIGLVVTALGATMVLVSRATGARAASTARPPRPRASADGGGGSVRAEPAPG